MKGLPVLGDAVYTLLLDLVTAYEHEPDKAIYKKKSDCMEETVRLVIEELRKEGLSYSGSDFLLDHGPIIQAKIKDPGLRDTNAWVE